MSNDKKSNVFELKDYRRSHAYEGFLDDDEEWEEIDWEELGEFDIGSKIDREEFAEGILRFSCFRMICNEGYLCPVSTTGSAQRIKDPDALFDRIFQAYDEDQLTEDQVHTVEFLVHMQVADYPFALAEALFSWSKSDRESALQFLAEISAHLD